MDMISSRWLRRKRLWAVLAIASCIVAVIVHFPVSTWLPSAQTWIASQGIWAFPAFITIYIVAAVMGLPNIVLILAAGPLFGLTEGVMTASIADTLSIAACFLIGQTVGRRWIASVVRENSRFHKLDHAFAQKGWKIVLLTRLSPILPSNILNYGFSITRINFWEYLFFSWLGMVPVIFTYVYIGTFGANIFNSQSDNSIFQLLGLITTVGVMFYTTKLAASALNTEDLDSDEQQPEPSKTPYQWRQPLARKLLKRSGDASNRSDFGVPWASQAHAIHSEVGRHPKRLALPKVPVKR
ncbi:MAG: TVP38/TMEM64 family protein [Cyanobacteria bacterium P01_A01_bin.116]